MLSELIKFMDRQFGRASMLAKLSLVFNIALSYVIIVLHENDKQMKNELIKSYSDKYTEQNDLMIRLKLLKESTSSPNELNHKIDQIAEDQKQ